MRNTTRIIKCDIEEVVGKEKQLGGERKSIVRRGCEISRLEERQWSGIVEQWNMQRKDGKRNRQIETDLQEGKLATVHLSPLPVFLTLISAQPQPDSIFWFTTQVSS
ncbi:hypothetical protein WR25_03863 [Diploscapter pachys]|uniref:Uncharacterized protein n=1 Tax=Diploscapter pachys TaxID=2018661 RepID=A0A2A2JMT1_9BILA|nr:hypothetical protein WR25_03863 [Diploscapter pachys]